MLQTRPNGPYKIEFFANHTLNASGFAEGEVFLGSLMVTTDATGTASFTFTSTPNPLGVGSAVGFFTATATNLAAGATSEFSAPVALSH